MQPFTSLFRLAFSAAIILASLSLVSAASVPARRQTPDAIPFPHNRPLSPTPAVPTVTPRSIGTRRDWKKFWSHNPWDKDYKKHHPCRDRSGIIRVYNAADDSELGFVDGNLDAFGLLGLTTNVTEALDVSFKICTKKCGVIGPLNAKADNPAVDFFGGIVGLFSTDDNISVGSPNYIYLGGVGQKTKPGSPAQPGPNTFSTATGAPEDSETAIWYLDLASNELTAQWINTDKSEPNTHIVYAPEDDDFVLTGDVATYAARFNGFEVYFILDQD